jgi:hypothetical protein
LRFGHVLTLRFGPTAQDVKPRAGLWELRCHLSEQINPVAIPGLVRSSTLNFALEPIGLQSEIALLWKTPVDPESRHGKNH